MKAVHFGAGNIGRGFIGQLLHQNGFEICFVDTNADLINQLNQDGGYRIDIMDEQETTVFVDRISALNSLTEIEKVIAAIEDADILTTSVGANNLAKIAPTIAKGLSERFKQKRSINILANENAINASNILKEAVYETLSQQDTTVFDHYAYFVNTAIDRQSLGKVVEGKAVAVVEPYYEWVINRMQLDPATPFELKQVVLIDDMQPYIERKLYIVNAAHAAIAYLGDLHGYQTIQEAIRDAEIVKVLNQFLAENSAYFVQKYRFDTTELERFIEKTLKRQGNQKLSDEITRVGGSPIRKLGPNDRLVTPVVKLEALGLPYETGVKVIAAGYHYRHSDDPEAEKIHVLIEEKGLEATIKTVSHLDGKLLEEVVVAYDLMG
ncbi:mannitol-1-phosphate 5-dehydrogenase [Enterococcus avium]|uniref:mannitol-1-phosphate 5-dehydrogenase n=1 Tax=Enterococcus avium TaxID=33945 RepID=UPI001A95F3A0|nr:mannitol-1-phosphate 5-dehydrogenase [Enterococcus avium]MBO1141547.1 mannitol-1-phosphate 5-dehydrogenase [Enterococcus avium]MDT2481069.1 mannitol-1-phosphate 5-dehydrogenase [Enterococcus avium]